ncbi:MAG: hypothetical protein V8Q79_07555 [Christensenellales bacterium]
MPVSDVWKMSRNRPREQNSECFAAFGGSEGAKESPKRRESKNDDNFLKKRKKREDISV